MGFHGGRKPQKGRHGGGGYNRNNPYGKGNDPKKNKNNPGKNNRGQNNQKTTTVKYIVPAETLKALPGDPWKNIDNLSLKLEKFAPYEWGKTIKVSGNVLKSKVSEEGIKITRDALDVYGNFFKLYLEMVKKLAKIEDNVFTMKTASRLVVGLGDESVYETSVRLLRNYGLPYIPGTALKGIARAYALEKFTDENLNKLKDLFKTEDFYEIVGRLDKALSNGGKLETEKGEEKLEIEATFGENKLKVSFQELVEIFGTTKNSGKVVFFDALPRAEPENENKEDSQKKPPEDNNIGEPLEFDIMNPHYGPYYQKGEAPGDWHDPVPVIFLVVRPGIEFTFAVAPLGSEELARKAGEILKEALREHGVGAKTSLGYGRFQ